MQPDQDAPQPANNNPQSPPANGQSASPVVIGGSSGSPKWLLWLLIILLVLALLFGWWWFMMRDDPPAVGNAGNSNGNNAQEPPAEACNEGLASYENSDLGIGFCYPADWGDAEVSDARLQKTPTEVDGETIAADTGERWLISFSDKPAVNLGLVSADWSTQIGRGGSCLDPATQTLPSFSPFSTDWEAEPAFVSRGIEVEADSYLIEETADEFYNGVCISGYTMLDSEQFTHSTATYYVEFGGAVTTPEQHATTPNVLVSVPEREAFYAFVRSVYAL